MCQRVLLRLFPRLVVRRAVENQIARLELLEGELRLADVKLVVLIAVAQCEAELLAQVPDIPPDEPAAIEEDRRVEEGLRIVEVSLCVGDANIALRVLDSLLS